MVLDMDQSTFDDFVMVHNNSFDQVFAGYFVPSIPYEHQQKMISQEEKCETKGMPEYWGFFIS
ncbi:hypothetical protein J25TS5_24920 [Paenibacillus faecis]|nr:hypothetical protein J25TS5_24920 [Paenibacillus faecis]